MYLAFQVSNEKFKIGFDWILSRYTLQQKRNDPNGAVPFYIKPAPRCG
jgi:hypothetical protein